MCHSKHLQHLDISNNSIVISGHGRVSDSKDRSFTEIMCEGVAQCHTLHSLTLDKNSLSKDGDLCLAQIITAAEHNHAFHRLSARGCKLSTVKAMFDAVKENGNITALDLSQNNISGLFCVICVVHI
jgi:Ran GTPase-activating protein (RanGAP) involved in mRNA processing and transport